MGSRIERIRRWIDGDGDMAVAEQVLQDSKNSKKRKSRSDLLLQKLKEEIETVLTEEEVTLVPNTNKAYVPPLFVVFIGPDDESFLPKEKREFFEENLSALILETAREIAGKLQLSTKTIKVNVRVSPTLQRNEVEVKAFSSTLDKTLEIALEKSFDWNAMPENQKTIDDNLRTINDEEFGFKPLYYLEVWRNGRKEKEYPIIKRALTVGRDYGGSKAHVRLNTDNLKISGHHASINCHETDGFTLTALHKNPTIVGDKALTKGETVSLGPSDDIEIYDFTLRLRFAD